jgi:hypothetical protein
MGNIEAQVDCCIQPGFAVPRVGKRQPRRHLIPGGFLTKLVLWSAQRQSKTQIARAPPERAADCEKRPRLCILVCSSGTRVRGALGRPVIMNGADPKSDTYAGYLWDTALTGQEGPTSQSHRAQRSRLGTVTRWRVNFKSTYKESWPSIQLGHERAVWVRFSKQDGRSYVDFCRAVCSRGERCSGAWACAGRWQAMRKVQPRWG